MRHSRALCDVNSQEAAAVPEEWSGAETACQLKPAVRIVETSRLTESVSQHNEWLHTAAPVSPALKDWEKSCTLSH